MKIIEIIATNSPGTMSHIVGLFSRRMYNIEGIMVVPKKESSESLILIELDELDNKKVTQIIAQIEKLHDIKKVFISENRSDVFPNLKKRLL